MNIQKIFGNDVQHLHGNLYRAKRSKIKLARSGLSVENGKLIYGNPRWFLNNNGKPEAKGIETAKMEELRNSIQEEGLENPIRLRVVNSDGNYFLEVVNGERRFRSIDLLCQNNALCFDPESGDYKASQELFDWIDCRIELMDEKTALRVALKPNETSENIGDNANLNVVKILRSAGYDDQEILKATGKSISWLRETEKILNLDDVCLQHHQNDLINRKVALHLADIQDAQERLEILEKIKQAAEKRYSEKVGKIKDQKEKASIDSEIEEASSKLAKNQGDEKSAEIHAKKASASKDVAQKKEDEIAKFSKKATSKDLNKIIDKTPLSSNKIEKLYLNVIQSIIESDGFDENGNAYGLNLDALRPILAVLQGIISGQKDIFEILNEHCAISFDEEVQEQIESEEESVEESSEYEEDSASDDVDDEYEEDEEEEEEAVDYEEEIDGELEREFENELASMDDGFDDE